VLAAFDQQRIAGVFGVVEERVIAQPLAGRVSAIDDDVLRRAQRLRERDALCCRPAIASGGQRSVIEWRSSR
jgi:hypothetical protein